MPPDGMCYLSQRKAIVQSTRTSSKKEIYYRLPLKLQVYLGTMNQDHTQNPSITHYTPSPQMADKLTANRQGLLTPTQRAPIIIAAIVTGVGLIGFSLFGIVALWGFVQTLQYSGFFGLGLICLTGGSLSFLIIVFWVNANMFVPESLNQKPVRWERGKLKIKMASRERPEMPFSYIVGDYSFAPFVAPFEVPLEKGREYIVYYTARSRLLLSLAPLDQSNSQDWLPD